VSNIVYHPKLKNKMKNNNNNGVIDIQHPASYSDRVQVSCLSFTIAPPSTMLYVVRNFDVNNKETSTVNHHKEK